MEVKGHCEPQHWMGFSDQLHTRITHKEVLCFHHMLHDILPPLILHFLHRSLYDSSDPDCKTHFL